ncbi:hypothetical protein U1Q18_043603, partial [Sarracenia purpurea var. burkii]
AAHGPDPLAVIQYLADEPSGSIKSKGVQERCRVTEDGGRDGVEQRLIWISTLTGEDEGAERRPRPALTPL